jgi:AraC family transcriptional regulator of adaptative response / DNA-3-methyladenine glycosylase II
VHLEPEICYRALRTRDPRFDGRFFTAVRTTRVYCRPICPARTPRRENCWFVPCAAAAEEAGYRPCRRCRPESAPGTPAWLGTSATVSRGLRLIADGALDAYGVGVLAARLGLGERQLRRLFTRHLGAAPLAIARTRRVHFAAELLAQTDWPCRASRSLPASRACAGSTRRSAPRSTARRASCARARPGPSRATPRRSACPIAHRSTRRAASPISPRARCPAWSRSATDRVRARAARRGRPLVVEVSAPATSARSRCARRRRGRALARARRARARGVRPARRSRRDRRQLGADPLLRARLRADPACAFPARGIPFEIAVRIVLGQQVTGRGRDRGSRDGSRRASASA